MQIVIDIPERTYRRIQALESNDYFEHDICGFSMQRIANGIPLPKGHGRLIDEERVSLSGIHFETERDHAMMIGRLNSAPTIIEADKESGDNAGWCNTCEYKYLESKCLGCAKYDEYGNLITLSKYKKESEENKDE